MKTFAVGVAALMWVLPGVRAEESGPAAETQRQFLSGTDKDHTVPWEFHSSGGRRSGQWTTIPVPSCWELQGFGTYRYGHEEKKDNPAAILGQYRHRFPVPTGWAGRRVFIVFDGAMTDADIKINGASAGPVHQGAFYRFKHDITGLLKFGQENFLEANVSDRSAEPSVNRAERQGDYWDFGGIFRPVWLEAVPMQSLQRVAIDARHDGSFALDFFLQGEGSADTVEVTVLDAAGRPLGEPARAPVAAGRVTARFERPAVWTAETPVLHTAVVRLQRGATVLHELRQRFGFRTIEVRPRDGIYVNGTKVVLKGACRHSFWPDSGRTLSEAVHRADIGLLKDMNANAVRMSHYPPDERFLELCDELGLYVLDELAGWQKCYDVEPGRKLLREMLARDVNHPCILFWDNGNEGGWNTGLDGDFAPLDPQRRNVLHPWELHGDVNTKHYPVCDAFEAELKQGEIVMPTEFLHGLFDGGLGAGLEDYWALVERYPNAAGGFLWALVDEGVRRDDTGAIDVKGNWAPDGIVGPYREKEASFLTIKQLWSPLLIREKQLPASFAGALAVENHYSFTDARQCRFSWQLRKFPGPAGAAAGFTVLAEGAADAPAIPPGGQGKLRLNLPADWRGADALVVRADDPAGRELWTWVWPLAANAGVPPAAAPGGARAIASETADEIRVQAGELAVTFSKQTGRLVAARRGNKTYALSNGPRLVVGDSREAYTGKDKGKDRRAEPDAADKPVEAGALTGLTQRAEGADVVVSAAYSGALKSVVWRVRADGWVTMDYAYALTGPHSFYGVGFDHPESRMQNMKWLGNGPCRAWQNRLAGGVLGVWTNAYNDTRTGESGWKYPEFKGYYANVRWMQWGTPEGPITAWCGSPLFVQVLKDTTDRKLAQGACAPYPEADVSFLHAIPPIGNKFHAASKTGPQGRPSVAPGELRGTVSFHFGEGRSAP